LRKTFNLPHDVKAKYVTKANAMYKIVSVCAAFILAGAAFSTSADAQRGGGARMGGGFGGGGARIGGGFSGARVGGIGGGGIGRVGGFSGARIGGVGGGGITRVGGFSGARVGGIGRVGGISGARLGGIPAPGRIGTLGGRAVYRGGVGLGRYAGYSYRGYRYAYRGYRPYLGAGIGALSLVSAWPYYGGYYDGYGYDDTYGYDDGYDYDDSGVAYCIQRFKSYDPASRTYLGYDGNRHSCP
jgi:hypothetical protein